MRNIRIASAGYAVLVRTSHVAAWLYYQCLQYFIHAGFFGFSGLFRGNFGTVSGPHCLTSVADNAENPMKYGSNNKGGSGNHVLNPFTESVRRKHPHTAPPFFQVCELRNEPKQYVYCASN